MHQRGKKIIICSSSALISYKFIDGSHNQTLVVGVRVYFLCLRN